MDIGIPKKEMGYVFSEFCIERLKARLLRYVNEISFRKVNSDLKDTYSGGNPTTALKNEVSICQQMYHNKENEVMINCSPI